MMKGLLWSCAILAISSASLAECDRMYTYGPGGEVMTMHVPRAGSTWGTIVSAPDSYKKLEFCRADSEYFCFLPYFAVPKRFDGSVRKWTLRERTFEVEMDNVTIQILGRRLDGLFIIKAPPVNKDAKPRRYVFSPRYGLVGFDVDGGGMIWVQEEFGFGSSEPQVPPYPAYWRRKDLCPKQ